MLQVNNKHFKEHKFQRTKRVPRVNRAPASCSLSLSLSYFLFALKFGLFVYIKFIFVSHIFSSYSFEFEQVPFALVPIFPSIDSKHGSNSNKNSEKQQRNPKKRESLHSFKIYSRTKQTKTFRKLFHVNCSNSINVAWKMVFR